MEAKLVPESDDNPLDNKRYDTFRLAENLLPLFGQVWLLTAGLIGVSVFLAEFSMW